MAKPGAEHYLHAMMTFRSRGTAALILVAAALAAMPAGAASKKHKTHPQPAAKQEADPNAAAAASGATPGAAQALGSSGAWSAYESKDRTGRVCYVVGQPQKSEPASAHRKQPSMMVTHRPDEKIANVVSFMAGYTLKDGSDAELDVGPTKFDLFTKDDSAWARTAELDKAIVTALTRAKQAVLKAVPPKGGGTADTYSLAGFSQAVGLIDKACGVKR